MRVYSAESLRIIKISNKFNDKGDIQLRMFSAFEEILFEHPRVNSAAAEMAGTEDA